MGSECSPLFNMTMLNNIKDRQHDSFLEDVDGETARRVADIRQRASANALLTLEFYELMGIDVPALNILTKNDLSPLTNNSGEFIIMG